MIQLLGDCPQTLTRVLPLDATGYFRPQTHTFVPTPRKYQIQWGWHGDGVEDEQHCRGFRRQCRGFWRQCRGFWRHCRWCGRGLTRRNTNGPPRAAPLVSYVAYATVTDDRRRRQTPATVTSLPPTLCLGGPVINAVNDDTVAIRRLQRRLRLVMASSVVVLGLGP